MNSNSGRSALGVLSLLCIFLLAACGSSTPVLRYITISPAGSTIATGTSIQYTATGYYSNGAITQGITVSWSSSTSTVATINGSSGVATGVAPGTTTITATALGITSTTTTLTVAGLTSIAVTPTTQTISVTATQQYDAVATYTTSGGTTGTEDVTAQVTWNSSNTSVATFSTTTPGLATGVAAGTTSVTATLGTVTSNTATLTVTAAVSLVVGPSTPPTIAVGNTTALTVQEQWADMSLHPPSGTVTWSSSATNQANVVGTGTGTAQVAGFAAGAPTITATEGTLTGTITVTVVTGSTHYAYITGVNDNTIYSYTVTAATAPYLASLATTTQTSATQTFLNPDGQYLYELDQTAAGVTHISVYSVTPATGAIALATGVTQAQTAGAGGSNWGTVDPYGRFVYVSDDGSGTATPTAGGIWGFTVNQSTGALTPITAVTGYTTNVNSPESMVIDHTGSFLYAINYGTGTTAGTISAYSIDPSTGNLTPLSTATYPTGVGPLYSTIDPTGTYLYVPNSLDNTVTGYSIGASGALTSLGSARAVTGATSVENVAVSPNGNYLYVLDFGTATNGQVFGFTLAAGVPSTTLISGTPIPTGQSPAGMAIDPTGALLAVDNAGNLTSASTISLFTIGSSGGLTSQTAAASGINPRFIVFYDAP
ncbi:MAG TPA: beta-propeller fold lactonase family protein [Candidatus Eremiobacteraceae bacterium]|nr:beta-propeller fold lactonase family protein [Candidatus Eremiobacteraceae bacterium]